MTDETWAAFEELRNSKLETARAWAIKETMMEVWDAEGDEDYLCQAWKCVLNWAKRSRLEPMKYDARGFRNRERLRRAILFHRGGLDLLPHLV